VASNTVTAQQIKILQANGIAAPKPRTFFLNNLIKQIQHWQHEQKEIILCMDANESLDDPKAAVLHLFTKTDLIDLHQHCYPLLQKPVTHQYSNHAIDFIAGSPLAVTALLHTWLDAPLW